MSYIQISGSCKFLPAPLTSIDTSDSSAVEKARELASQYMAEIESIGVDAFFEKAKDMAYSGMRDSIEYAVAYGILAERNIVCAPPEWKQLVENLLGKQ